MRATAETPIQQPREQDRLDHPNRADMSSFRAERCQNCDIQLVNARKAQLLFLPPSLDLSPFEHRFCRIAVRPAQQHRQAISMYSED
jgi:hypothetical protein